MFEKVVVSGALAQRPGRGGHTWVFLQYLIGLKRLGWDVLFVDRLDPGACRDVDGRQCSLADSENFRYISDTMALFDLQDSFAVKVNGGDQWGARDRRQVHDYARDAALLLNFNGFLDDEEILAAVSRRVYVDIDPGVGQMWEALGLHTICQGHDDYVTVGENIGSVDCEVPTCGVEWITTRPPVVLDSWPVAGRPDACDFTSIASWRGAFGPLEFNGKTYGSRVHEFRKFVEVPKLTGRSFRFALDIHPDEKADISLLIDNGWSLIDPASVAGDPSAYRSFIQGSKAEFMVAKNMVVENKCGWFSDRTACYLASGKPVVVQDTGLQDLYPTGAGLLTFTNVEGAVAAVEQVAADYQDHCRAARAVAHDCFDSDKVLSRLLGKLGFA